MLLYVYYKLYQVIGRLYISYYYTVAEVHIFLSEADLSRLTSRSRVGSTQVSQSIDNDLVE